MHYEYKTMGTCASKIILDVENGIIENARFVGGCHGNTQGISKLVIGMKVDDVIERLQGIRCGMKSTSCPDQLAQALLQTK
ncbi:MAG: TIGR03905 family TSCPD domain-containing protein [Ruminococcaceae bacterium]|nr:TIGR03905 family TSCPD domain-containing protein [Oscillospiraceae bacterium]